MVDMLCSLNQIKPVWVELGLQTIHQKTSDRIHRGYPLEVYEDAYSRLKERSLRVVVHVILGLPGESREEMLQTVRYLADQRPLPDGIKLQMLHILEGTRLAQEYRQVPFPVMNLEEYCGLITDCLRLLPPDITVHRLTGDGPKRLLIAPQWSADKKHVLNTLKRYIEIA